LRIRRDRVGDSGGRVLGLVLGAVVAAEFELDGVDAVALIAAVGLRDVAAVEAGLLLAVVRGKYLEPLRGEQAEEALGADVRPLAETLDEQLDRLAVLCAAKDRVVGLALAVNIQQQAAAELLLHLAAVVVQRLVIG